MQKRLAIFGPNGWIMCWDDNCSHVVNLNFVKDLYEINEHTFIVWDANNKSDTWKLYYFDDIHPQCECGEFISSNVHVTMLYSLFKL